MKDNRYVPLVIGAAILLLAGGSSLYLMRLLLGPSASAMARPRTLTGILAKFEQLIAPFDAPAQAHAKPTECPPPVVSLVRFPSAESAVRRARQLVPPEAQAAILCTLPLDPKQFCREEPTSRAEVPLCIAAGELPGQLPACVPLPSQLPAVIFFVGSGVKAAQYRAEWTELCLHELCEEQQP